MNEALQFQRGPGAICCDAYDYAERQDEWRRIGFWLGLPGLSWRVGRVNQGAELGADCSPVNFSGLVVQAPGRVEEPLVRLRFPIRFRD